MNYKNGDICKDRILVLDFYSQYTQLIARRIRELGVYCEVLCYGNLTEVFIRKFNPSGIILSGSPNSVSQNSIVDDFPKYIYQFDIPVLGICYGMHLMAVQFGGTVQSDLSKREFGCVQMDVLINNNILFEDIYDGINDHGVPVLDVWMSHTDSVVVVPNDFIVVGMTNNKNVVAVIAHKNKHLYGVQFHPEVTHTVQGKRILKRFVLKICNCKSLWKICKIIDYLMNDIRDIVKKDIVMLAFSGGIDSLVTALLLQKALGRNRLICYFVDTGFLRYNELFYVREFIHNYSLNVSCISAVDRFFNALVGVIDSEKKRKIIGQVFIEIFEEQKRHLSGDIRWLAQGTIYPDIIESGVSNVFNNFFIKSHHNVGGISSIKTMKLLEPIKTLFKDEVRDLGKELGISTEVLYRHPFPGPGLAIRILGEVKEEYCNILRQADNIFIEELKRCDLYTKISQAFVVFLPIRSVGIMGDIRKYQWVIALRAVETVDFMTANWVNLPYDFLSVVSNRIIREVSGVSRVVYDISSKPPSTIEWE